jgi:hypothetical protein
MSRESSNEDLGKILNIKIAEIDEFENKFSSKVFKVFFFRLY